MHFRASTSFAILASASLAIAAPQNQPWGPVNPPPAPAPPAPLAPGMPAPGMPAPPSPPSPGVPSYLQPPFLNDLAKVSSPRYSCSEIESDIWEG